MILFSTVNFNGQIDIYIFHAEYKEATKSKTGRQYITGTWKAKELGRHEIQVLYGNHRREGNFKQKKPIGQA